MATVEATRNQTSTRAALSPIQRLAWLLIAIIITVGAIFGIRRAVQARPDWEPLASEVRYVWQHGHTAPGTAMFGYLPTTSFALMPFMAWLPIAVGAPLYALTNLLAAGASVWIVWRHWPKPVGSTIVWPVLLASVNFAHVTQGNQLSLWALVLCIAGLTLVERRRGLAGGSVLGLAAALKTLPLMLLGYCVLRRRWRAAAGMLLGLVLFDIVPSIAYFGWQGAWDEHRAWVQRAGWQSNQRQIADPLLRAPQHKSNFSYSSVLARWLRAATGDSTQVRVRGAAPPDVVESTRAALQPGEVLTLDPMPPHDGGWSIERESLNWLPRYHIADWSAATVLTIWVVTIAAGLIALSWFTWVSPGAGPPWTALGALWMLAIFWPAPMARHYYLPWAFPALVVVCGTLEAELHAAHSPCHLGRVLAIAALAAWVIGIACLGWTLARWYGLHLGALALLTAATVWACRMRLASRTAAPSART